jgi:hypothetical protein
VVFFTGCCGKDNHWCANDGTGRLAKLPTCRAPVSGLDGSITTRPQPGTAIMPLAQATQPPPNPESLRLTVHWPGQVLYPGSWLRKNTMQSLGKFMNGTVGSLTKESPYMMSIALLALCVAECGMLSSAAWRRAVPIGTFPPW